MNTIIKKTKEFFGDKTLRNKVLFVVCMFVIFKLFSNIPIPGVDTARLAGFLTNNQFFGVLNIFAGGGLSNFSLVMLGVGPYITASIIMQLLTVVFPKLKRLYQEEGEIGRKKFAKISRWITVPLAFLQGFALITLLERQAAIETMTLSLKLINITIAVSGTMFLLWLADRISEHGIGNGTSLIIFAGIVAAIPTNVSQFLFNYTSSELPMYIVFAVVGLLIIAGVVFVTEAERPIPVTYARTGANGASGGANVSTYVPIRINQAGVMPIIFALSILMVPQLIGTFLATKAGMIGSIGQSLSRFTQESIMYTVLYFVFVFFFTYFYTAVTFDPKQMAQNLSKGGAFVPGVRPGDATEKYIGNIVGRITLIGALFLSIIAILPLIVQRITGITTIAIGGTALLIVVSVVVDILKKSDAQLSMKAY
jgi:preprotein translocase subunit SecY